MRGVPALTAALPLSIGRAEFSDPTLIIGAEEWSLAATCPWRWLAGGSFVASCASPDASDSIWGLIGHTIMAAEWQSTTVGWDPVLRLSDESVLELFSDAAYDTWVLRLAETTIVGPLLEN